MNPGPIYATYNGEVISVTQQPDGKWKVVVKDTAGTLYTYIVDVANVAPCQMVTIGTLIGSINPIASYIDEKVKVSSTDTTPGYLMQEMQAGPGILFTKLNPNADEKLLISSDPDFFKIQRVQYRVGDVGMPVAGMTSFTLLDCNGNVVIDKHVEWFREEGLQSKNDPDFGYSYNPVNGLISNIAPALYHRERMIFMIYNKLFWQMCFGEAPAGSGGGCEFDMELDFELCA